MKKIVKPSASGKTTELIKMAEATGAYIIVSNQKRAHDLFMFAESLGYKIPYPVPFEQCRRVKRTFVKNILIDDADELLSMLFPGMTIDAITMTEEPNEI